MTNKQMIVNVAVPAATMWATNQVMKQTGLPAAARPFVGMVVAAAVTKAAQQLL
jgi:hypothetical protein